MSSTRMKHTDEETTCPVLNEPSNYHFEGRCEDCDVKEMSRLSLGKIEDRYQTGRLTQDEFEAYCYVWSILSPTGSRPEWQATPEIPDVRRIARKLLRARGLSIPGALTEAVSLAGGRR